MSERRKAARFVLAMTIAEIVILPLLGAGVLVLALGLISLWCASLAGWLLSQHDW